MDLKKVFGVTILTLLGSLSCGMLSLINIYFHSRVRLVCAPRLMMHHSTHGLRLVPPMPSRAILRHTPSAIALDGNTE